MHLFVGLEALGNLIKLRPLEGGVGWSGVLPDLFQFVSSAFYSLYPPRNDCDLQKVSCKGTRRFKW